MGITLYNLLIAKFKAYEHGYNSLTFLLDYLASRKQRTKTDTSYSSWTEAFQGIPLASILGRLVLNTFINDIFVFARNQNFLILSMMIIFSRV